MAFPVIAGSALSNEAANVTNHDIALPASVAAGDLLIAWSFQDGNAAANSWPGSWVELLDLGIGGTLSWVTIGYLIASGGETTVAVTSTNAERSNHIAVRITGWHGTTPPAISASATGLSTTPNPDSLDPAGWAIEDTLWIPWCGLDTVGSETGDQTFSVFPYAANNITSQLTASAAWGAICSTESAVASIDPGTFTNGLSRDWRAGTIAVRPAAGGATLERTVADGVATTESLARMLALARSASESIPTTETPTRVLTIVRSPADSVVASAVVTRTVTLARPLADTIATSDAVAAVKTGLLIRTVADAVVTSELVSRTVSLVRGIADTVAATDAVTRTTVALRAAADVVATSELVARVASSLRAVADAVVTSDAVTRAGGFIRSVADTVGTSTTVAVSVISTAIGSIGIKPGGGVIVPRPGTGEE